MNDKQNENKLVAPASQRRKFIATAKNLGCDEAEAAFDAKLGKIAKPQKKSNKNG